MDEALLAATSPHGNTPAEIYATIRDNALEDAARLFDESEDDWAAVMIRALKSKEPA